VKTLLIDADLACPPNEIYAFRTFTFVANKYCEFEVLAEINNWEFRDTYWFWFKNNYLLDNVKDIIQKGSSTGYTFKAPKITLNNLRESLETIGFKHF